MVTPLPLPESKPRLRSGINQVEMKDRLHCEPPMNLAWQTSQVKDPVGVFRESECPSLGITLFSIALFDWSALVWWQCVGAICFETVFDGDM